MITRVWFLKLVLKTLENLEEMGKFLDMTNQN